MLNFWYFYWSAFFYHSCTKDQCLSIVRQRNKCSNSSIFDKNLYHCFPYRLLFGKKKELGDAANKLKNGLSKIDDTREKVEKMSVELEDAKTKVAQFQKQCEEYLVIIVSQKREADEQQKVGWIYSRIERREW